MVPESVYDQCCIGSHFQRVLYRHEHLCFQGSRAPVVKEMFTGRHIGNGRRIAASYSASNAATKQRSIGKSKLWDVTTTATNGAIKGKNGIKKELFSQLIQRQNSLIFKRKQDYQGYQGSKNKNTAFHTAKVKYLTNLMEINIKTRVKTQYQCIKE